MGRKNIVTSLKGFAGEVKRRVAVGGEETHRYQLEGLCGGGETESVLLVGKKHIVTSLKGFAGEVKRRVCCWWGGNTSLPA